MLFDDSENEEENRVPRQSLFLWVRTNYILNELFFRESFRIDQDVFDLLEGFLSPYLAVTKRNNSLSPREQLLTALHFLGNGAQYHVNAYMHTISKSTVCRCVHRVCRLIAIHLMPIYVRWPSETQIIEAQFYQKSRFPHVKGIVDGTLVYIDAPKDEEPIYVGRNNKHSINVVLVCGPQHQFFFVSALSPGSFHDSRALRISKLWKVWDRQGWRPNGDNNSVILGDSAYPLRQWLMPPTVRNINANDVRLAQAVPAFLLSHRRTRFVIECAIGILKEEYPCLNHFRFRTPSRISTAIYAVVTLHNMQNNYRNGSYAYDTVLNRIANQMPPDDDEAVANEDELDARDYEAPPEAGIAMQRQILERFA